VAKAKVKVTKKTKSPAKKAPVKKTVAQKKPVKKTVSIKKIAPKAVNKKAAPKKSVLSKSSPVKKNVKAAVQAAFKAVASVKSKAPTKKQVVTPSKNDVPAKASVKTKAGLTPLDNRIVVSVVAADLKTAGGLYIPDTAQQVGNKKGEVIAVGRGHLDKKGQVHPVGVSVGEVVLFSPYAGAQIEINGQDLLVLRETDILGILESN
jgi:chaperonin GroES